MQFQPEYSAVPEQFILVGGIVSLLIILGLASGLIYYLRHSRPQSLPWRERMLFLRDIPISGTALLVLTAILLMIFGLTVLAAMLFETFFEGEWGFLVQTIGFHWVVIIFISALKFRTGASWKNLFGFSLKGFTYQASRGLLAYLIAFPILLAAAFLYQMLLIKLGYEPTQQPIMNFLAGELSVWTRLYGIAVAILLAPVAEEILFRGMLMPVLSRGMGPVYAVIASSLLFACMHMFIPALVPLFLVAVAFSLAYIYTGSLTTAIVFHSIFNTVNLTLFTILYGVG